MRNTHLKLLIQQKMSFKITLKKVGNHWYPSINHNRIQEIVLDPKLEKLLSLVDTDKLGILTMSFTKSYGFTQNTLFFKDEDINRYFITNDDFDLSCFVENHEFKINSKLYCLLEREFNFSFHILIYNVQISNYEV